MMNGGQCNSSSSSSRKMVLVGFRRSISFSTRKVLPSLTPTCHRTARDAADLSSRELSFRVRSISLPARLHPLVSHVDTELDALRSWLKSSSAAPPASSWLCDGLDRLRLLLVAFSDLLQLPQAQDTLKRRRTSPFADRLLNDFLRLADAHGSFRCVLINLKHNLSEIHTVLRRKVDQRHRLNSYLLSQRLSEKEIFKLASMVREASRVPLPPTVYSSDDGDELMELAKVMKEVITMSASALAAVYARISALSTATTTVATVAPAKCPWVAGVQRWRERARLRVLKKKGSSAVAAAENVHKEEIKRIVKVMATTAWQREAVERLVALEDCIAKLESGSEQVFRSLVNSRVSILNILTPSF